MDRCFIPEGYKSALDVRETEHAIKYVKDTFEHTFADAMRLLRISAPLFDIATQISELLIVIIA